MMASSGVAGSAPRSDGSVLGVTTSDLTIILAINYAAAIAMASAITGLDSTIRALLLAAGTLGVAAVQATFGPMRRGRMNSLPIGAALIAFVVMSALANQLANLLAVREDGDAMWRQLILALLPVILFWSARSWAWHRFSLRGLDLGMAVLIILCLLSVGLEIMGLVAVESYGTRHFGVLGDSVAWVATLPTLYFLVRARWGLLGLCLIVMIVTQTRGAYIVLFGGLLLTVFLMPVTTKRAYLMRIGAMIGGICSVLLAQSLMNTVLQRFADIDFLENDRTRTLEFTFQVFLNRPILGSGYNAHTYYFVPSTASMDASLIQWSTPVSTFAQVLADAGILGFIPFFAAMAMMCYVAYRAIVLPTRAEEIQSVVAVAAWLIPFVTLNHTAAWLLPTSLLPPLVFVAAGVVVGAMGRIDETIKSGASAAGRGTGLLRRRLYWIGDAGRQG